jgi:hypothetical protein
MPALNGLAVLERKPLVQGIAGMWVLAANMAARAAVFVTKLNGAENVIAEVLGPPRVDVLIFVSL